MSTSYIGFVFQQDGFGLALDWDRNPVRVDAKPGTSLPPGFSICRIEIGKQASVAEVLSAHAGTPQNTRATLLKTKWDEAYPPFKWDRDVRQQPFLSLDIESDGAQIWEAAMVPSDGAEGFAANGGAILLDDLQRALNRLLPGRILVGHNVRQWDMLTLRHLGVRMPATLDVWDTLEMEQELCKGRPRPSYALQTAHHAEQDAQAGIDLARNQWLRKNAPPDLAEKAWGESGRFFIVPGPIWTKLVPELNTAQCTWQDVLQAYRSIDPATVEKAIRGVKWRVITPPRGESASGPFNPASPKRLDYWHRLLPAVEAACSGSKSAILFVHRLEEIEKLVEIIQGAFTGDVRRCIRRLERRGGLLVLHESEWGRTLAECLPRHTLLILEKMPESNSDVKVAEDASDLGDSDENESGDDPDLESDDVVDTFIKVPRADKSQPTPDLQEMAKMTLWQRKGEKSDFVCLDARLWNERTRAPFTFEQVPCPWHAVVSRERMEQAAFRQTTGEFDLKEDWEEDICRWFDVKGLRPFQRSKLARILPRVSMPYEYVERATGGGKSLIFQAAALYRGATTGRLTVVISPLRALIHDQVGKLHGKGFALDVEALSGDMSRADIEDGYRRIAGGETKIVYTAPERFRSKGFLQALETRIDLDEGGQPEFWVFDEAHCISLWGLEFRPDYRKAAAYIRESCKRAGVNAAPVLLVSATLTRLAKDDIEKVLGF